ncbi:hypothetical protein QEH52_04080 [Coraliomargarita sp. SDUM461003]|uniref:Uncharacterized protein n=1 Tax=Thalassobacterium maritimum TaxID=3041265 RepID=A0ABU1AR89_9BACT|nr:hypothetical protein [Coraliomargarita sp. SDUM461003]MDQ8206674.1 hypothetical protein [Coraliomargarita sp. SDUM461003]
MKAIAPIDSSKTLFDDGPTILRALHENMFKQLYNIGLSIRILFEASIDYDIHDGEEEYIEYLSQKYALSDIQRHTLKMEWADGDENLCHELLEHDLHLKIFPNDDTCFQVSNSTGDYLLKLPPFFRIVMEPYYPNIIFWLVSFRY